MPCMMLRVVCLSVCQPESFSALRNLAHVLRTTGQVEDAALLYGQLVELYDACEIHKSHGKRAETNANSSSTTNHMAKHTRPEVCDAMSKSIETKEGFQVRCEVLCCRSRFV